MTTTTPTALAAASDALEALITSHGLFGVPEDEYLAALNDVVDALAEAGVPPYLAATVLDLIAVDAREGRVHRYHVRAEVGRALDAAQAPLDAVALLHQDEHAAAIQAELQATQLEIAAATAAGRFGDLPALRQHAEITLTQKAAEAAIPAAHRPIVVARHVVAANARRMTRAEQAYNAAQAHAEELRRQADAAAAVAGAAHREVLFCQTETAKREELLLEAATAFNAAATGLPSIEALREQYAAGIR